MTFSRFARIFVPLAALVALVVLVAHDAIAGAGEVSGGGGVTAATADADYVNVTGDTMTGDLFVGGYFKVTAGNGTISDPTDGIVQIGGTKINGTLTTSNAISGSLGAVQVSDADGMLVTGATGTNSALKVTRTSGAGEGITINETADMYGALTVYDDGATYWFSLDKTYGLDSERMIAARPYAAGENAFKCLDDINTSYSPNFFWGSALTTGDLLAMYTPASGHTGDAIGLHTITGGVGDLQAFGLRPVSASANSGAYMTGHLIPSTDNAYNIGASGSEIATAWMQAVDDSDGCFEVNADTRIGPGSAYVISGHTGAFGGEYDLLLVADTNNASSTPTGNVIRLGFGSSSTTSGAGFTTLFPSYTPYETTVLIQRPATADTVTIDGAINTTGDALTINQSSTASGAHIRFQTSGTDRGYLDVDTGSDMTTDCDFEPVGASQDIGATYAPWDVGYFNSVSSTAAGGIIQAETLRTSGSVGTTPTAPSAMYTCGVAYAGMMIYYDDTDDTTAAKICACLNNDTGGGPPTYGWFDIIGGTSCP